MGGAEKLHVQSVATGHGGDSGKVEGSEAQNRAQCPFTREVQVTEQS